MMRRSPHHRSPLSKLSHAATAAAAGLATAAGALEGAASGLVDSASHAVTSGGQLSHAVAAKAGAKAENAVAKAEGARRSPDKLKRTPEKRRAGRRAPGRSGVRDRIHQFDSASQSNIVEGRRRDEDVGRRQKWVRRQGRDGQDDARRGEGGRRADQGDRTAKDEGRGKKSKASPKRTDKENAPNRREGLQRRSPPFRHKKRERRAENESETKPEGEAQADENVDIAELNRAAVSGHSNHDSRATIQAGNTSDTKRGRSPREAGRTRKRHTLESRDPDEHPLIQSPLRKHMKVVRASACSNATGTVTKEPFPLVPPGSTGNPLAAVAGWNEESGAETARDERLGELGAVTGSVPLAAAIPAHPDCMDEGKKSTGRREGSGEALDLLTSAAFLFQHSRRNLG